MRVANDLVDYLVAQGMPTAASAITREHLERYLVHLQERPNRHTGKPVSAANVAKHYRTLQQLFRWLDEVEGEIEQTPFARMSAPQVPEKPVPVLTPEQLRALLAACKGKTFEQRRDEALVRMFADTGARIGEIAPLRLDDLDFDADIAHVTGKGRRPQAVPFGPKTGEALRRYLRARSRHPKAADTDAVWIGRKGPLTDFDIRRVLERRADDAGVPHVHPRGCTRSTLLRRKTRLSRAETRAAYPQGWPGQGRAPTLPGHGGHRVERGGSFVVAGYSNRSCGYAVMSRP